MENYQVKMIQQLFLEANVIKNDNKTYLKRHVENNKCDNLGCEVSSKEIMFSISFQKFEYIAIKISVKLLVSQPLHNLNKYVSEIFTVVCKRSFGDYNSMQR